MVAALVGCDRSDTHVSSGTASLAQYIHLNAQPKAVRLELATLPERNPSDSGVPRPTDYVALIAAVTLKDSDGKEITDQPRYAERQPIPEAFLRAWLSSAEKTALRDAFSQKGGLAYDVSQLVTRPTKRAVAIPMDADHWVLYLEYVAP
ncbi:hypothetical protein PI87_06510 [Ralstonia sp. A12]|uniref:hypothetical protein n=1 Tax=Ralstonia sp. A12 TaxID=1217052 RepID=UPI0005753E5E|nr:hypothetical protein [Ralstonia sp. A12]KHK58056.1 hypothetical protein PI87_06510 [Ralstonia sp. A12]